MHLPYMKTQRCKSVKKKKKKSDFDLIADISGSFYDDRGGYSYMVHSNSD